MSRPSDAINGDDPAGEEPEIISPALGATEWLRWGWRQLTSMRTALLLLLALAIAAVPGSLIPQQSSDPNGVLQWRAANPGLVPLVDALQGFSVYTSVWFSAIYLLLFVSLVGCVVPRVRHHLQALRVAPPRTPARLERLPAHLRTPLRGDTETAIADAETLLRRRRYRVRRYGASVSAERGYLRETGNLVFHVGLVGILIAVFVGGGFTYTGQRLLVPGQTFVNTQANYDSPPTTGRFFTPASLQPYSLRLQHLAVRYETHDVDALGQPIDYTATVGTTDPNGHAATRTIKVNSPLEIGGDSVYLLGNGYAPKITVRNADGSVAFSDLVPFIPQNALMTSLGVVKVPDAKVSPLGMLGFFYPSAVKLKTGAFTSNYPDLVNPLLTLNVYSGDLKLDSAAGSSVFQLNTDGMTKVAGRTKDFETKALELRPGQTAKLPNRLGSVTFDLVPGRVARYASFDIHHDPSQGWVAGFVALTVAGLITSLLVPRRRMWVAVTGEDDGELTVEYAALARGDDPGLERAVAELAEEHGRALAEHPAVESSRVPTGV